MEQKTKKTRWWLTALVGVALILVGAFVVTGGGFHDILLVAGAVCVLYGGYEFLKNLKK